MNKSDDFRNLARERSMARADAQARAQVPTTYEWAGSPDTAPGYFDPHPGATHNQRVARLESLRDARLTTFAGNLQALSGQALDVIEESVLSEVRSRSHTCGKLFETRNRCDDGRVWTRRDGDPRVWMGDFKAPGVRIRINNRAGQHKEGGQWVRDGFHLEEVANS